MIAAAVRDLVAWWRRRQVLRSRPAPVESAWQPWGGLLVRDMTEDEFAGPLARPGRRRRWLDAPTRVEAYRPAAPARAVDVVLDAARIAELAERGAFERETSAQYYGGSDGGRPRCAGGGRPGHRMGTHERESEHDDDDEA